MISRELGKIEAAAFGARKPKSKLSNKTQIFNHCNLLLYKSKKDKPYTIKDVTVINYNDNIRIDVNKYFIASCIAEEINNFIEKESVDFELFNVIKNAFKILNEIKQGKIIYLLTAFEIKLLSILGYGIRVNTCVYCGQYIKSTPYVDKFRGFPLCESCKTDGSILLKNGALKFILWIQENNLSKIKKVTMSEETLNNIRKFIRYMFIHIFHDVPKGWKNLDIDFKGLNI